MVPLRGKKKEENSRKSKTTTRVGKKQSFWRKGKEKKNGVPNRGGKREAVARAGGGEILDGKLERNQTMKMQSKKPSFREKKLDLKGEKAQVIGSFRN